MQIYDFSPTFLCEPKNPEEPLFTIRRIIVSGSLSADGMLKTMQSTFNK